MKTEQKVIRAIFLSPLYGGSRLLINTRNIPKALEQAYKACQRSKKPQILYVVRTNSTVEQIQITSN